MVRKEESVEKIKKHVNFYAKKSEIKNAYFSNMHMILHVYLEAYFNTNDLDHCLFNVYVFLLQDFRTSFLMRFLVGCLLRELSIKLILFLKHLYLISQPIEVISTR
jgi:uncharacterized membrane protein